MTEGANPTEHVPCSLPCRPHPTVLYANSQLFSQTWLISSLLIPLGSQEIFYPKSHLISTLKGISPLSPPALMIPGQGDHLLSQGHPRTRWKESWDKGYRPLEEVESEPVTCRENRPSHSSTSLGGGDFP